MEYPGVAGLGEPGKPDLWLTATEAELNPTHLAFAADRAQVDAFHAAAQTAGGTDNGPPGVRTDYHPHYYAAFILDPEGNNVEVVCQADPNAHPAAAKAAPMVAAKAKAKAKPKAKAKAATKPKAKAKAKAKPKAKAAAKKPPARKTKRR
jgi:hypothetical protein